MNPLPWIQPELQQFNKLLPIRRTAGLSVCVLWASVWQGVWICSTQVYFMAYYLQSRKSLWTFIVVHANSNRITLMLPWVWASRLLIYLGESTELLKMGESQSSGGKGFYINKVSWACHIWTPINHFLSPSWSWLGPVGLFVSVSYIMSELKDKEEGRGKEEEITKVSWCPNCS